MIWSLIHPPPRIIQFTYQTNPLRTPVLHCVRSHWSIWNSLPSLKTSSTGQGFYICQESRYFTALRKIHLHREKHPTQSTWCSPQTDILFWNSDPFPQPRQFLNAMFPKKEPFRIDFALRTLAISAGLWRKWECDRIEARPDLAFANKRALITINGILERRRESQDRFLRRLLEEDLRNVENLMVVFGTDSMREEMEDGLKGWWVGFVDSVDGEAEETKRETEVLLGENGLGRIKVRMVDVVYTGPAEVERASFEEERASPKRTMATNFLSASHNEI